MNLQKLQKETTEYVKKYTNVIIAGPRIMMLLGFNNKPGMARAALVDAQEAYEKYKRKVAPNNWLKMHGYPMRRKRRRT